ncbi:hypothetical protein A3E49_02105 [Candidatus Saccharibacteria bacterium RIFCSPHIGHO2_12_FULL_49_19]|nr:MAG: hypothetical protein A3E49_02105 [Candidatus Saccharibacteria bacterium RIFCSPHIGHO2_12_FULL_49_19]
MAKTKKTIAVDIDEVLMPHFQDLIDWYNKQYGTELTALDNHPTDPRPWGTDSFEEAIRRVHRFFDTQTFKNSMPFSEAKQAVLELSRNYKMIVITARDTILERATKDWLDEHFKELFTATHFTARYNLEGEIQTKASVALANKTDYLIDDALDHCEDAAKVGIKALLFGEYPWNQSDKLPKGVVRVKNWQEVLDYFEGR